MCIVALAWQVLTDTPLCLISNRDEFYRRPTAALAAWPDSPIVAARFNRAVRGWALPHRDVGQ